MPRSLESKPRVKGRSCYAGDDDHRPSRIVNGICSLNSFPLNPPLSSVNRKALWMKMVRTARPRPTHINCLVSRTAVGCDFYLPDLKYLNRRVSTRLVEWGIPSGLVPSQSQRITPAASREWKQRGYLEKRPATLMFFPRFFSEVEQAVAAMPPTKPCSTRLSRSQVQNVRVYVRGFNREE